MNLQSRQSPMTNLHLLNRRRDPAELWPRMSAAARDALSNTCRRVASLFPSMVCLGIDVLLAPGFCHHAVLETNAFGDLLPGVLHDGLETYTAQVRYYQQAGWLT